MSARRAGVTASIFLAASAVGSAVPVDGDQVGDLRLSQRDGTVLSRPFKGREGEEKSHEDEGSSVGAIGVVPFYRGLLSSPRCEDKLRALEVLARFNDDAAFQGLQDGISVTAGDFSDVPGEQTAGESADTVRSAAAAALAQSPYPYARPFLRSFEDDPLPAIRLTVLKMIGSRRTHTSADFTYLRRKTIDSDPVVASEATRLLRAWTHVS